VSLFVARACERLLFGAGGATADPKEGAGTTGAGADAAASAKMKAFEIPSPPSPSSPKVCRWMENFCRRRHRHEALIRIRVLFTPYKYEAHDN